jgi:hypothetical protein
METAREIEKNVHIVALRHKWPPGSWDHLNLKRVSRIFEAAREMAENDAAAIWRRDG